MIGDLLNINVLVLYLVGLLVMGVHQLKRYRDSDYQGNFAHFLCGEPVSTVLALVTFTGLFMAFISPIAAGLPTSVTALELDTTSGAAGIAYVNDSLFNKSPKGGDK